MLILNKNIVQHVDAEHAVRTVATRELFSPKTSIHPFLQPSLCSATAVATSPRARPTTCATPPAPARDSPRAPTGDWPSASRSRRSACADSTLTQQVRVSKSRRESNMESTLQTLFQSNRNGCRRRSGRVCHVRRRPRLQVRGTQGTDQRVRRVIGGLDPTHGGPGQRPSTGGCDDKDS